MRNNTNKYKSFILFFITFLFIFSCNSFEKKDEFYYLYYSPENSTRENSFSWDSMFIEKYKMDSIIIKRYYRESYYFRFYFYQDGSFYERRKVTNIHTGYNSMDTLLMFSKKDTTYKYHSKREDFITNLISLSVFHGKYTIQNDKGIYFSQMQSMYDTTYSEFYYYDRNYKIYKFVNTLLADTCVYLRKN